MPNVKYSIYCSEVYLRALLTAKRIPAPGFRLLLLFTTHSVDTETTTNLQLHDHRYVRECCWNYSFFLTIYTTRSVHSVNTVMASMSSMERNSTTSSQPRDQCHDSCRKRADQSGSAQSIMQSRYYRKLFYRPVVKMTAT